MNAGTMSSNATLAVRRTSQEHAPAQVTRLNFDPSNFLLRGLWRSARSGATADHIDFKLTCQ
jgi:hypothetical protein